MVAQTIQFDTVSVSEIGSGTITAFLFSGTTLSATLGSIAENGTLKGRNTGVVNDIAAGRYRLVVKFDGYTVSESDEVVDLLLAVGTYVSYRAAVLDAATQTQLDSIETDVAALSAAGEITISSPVVDVGSDGLPVKIEIVQGADYLHADDTDIELTLTGTFPDWTSGAAYLAILCGGVELSLTGTITTATGGTRVVYFELTATQSATLVDSTKDTPSQDIGVFDLRVVLSNTHVTYPVNRGKFVSRRRSQA